MVGSQETVRFSTPSFGNTLILPARDRASWGSEGPATGLQACREGARERERERESLPDFSPSLVTLFLMSTKSGSFVYVPSREQKCSISVVWKKYGKRKRGELLKIQLLLCNGPFPALLGVSITLKMNGHTLGRLLQTHCINLLSLNQFSLKLTFSIDFYRMYIKMC